MASQAIAGPKQRVDWVHYTHGFAITMVVMLHSTCGGKGSAIVRERLIENVGAISLAVTAIVGIAALVIAWAARDTRGGLLVRRPARA